MDNEEFLSYIEEKFKETIGKYGLLSRKDKIVVAASGGKDSAAALYLLKKFGYNVSALYINLYLGKYSEDCLNAVKKLCDENKIKLKVIDIKKIFGMRMCNIRCGVQKEINVSNCMICGIVKKWILNKEARKLGFDKIVTGHHLDDESQTIIMNFLQGNLEIGLNSGPETGSVQDKKFIPRIKPLYFISEKEIKKYAEIKKLPVIYEKCPCAVSSLRLKTRAFLQSKDTKLKENLVNNFLKMLPEMRKKYYGNNKDKKINYCEICGEPARGEICKKCELLGVSLKKKNKKIK